MPFVDLDKPGEKKKLIWAAVLGLVAIIFLWWTFVGFGSRPASRAAVRPTPTPTPEPQRADGQGTNDRLSPAKVDLASIQPIKWEPSAYNAPEARRNIFAYYEPPPPSTPAPTIVAPPPTPTPPILLASISPANAYARSPEFKLEAAGDKFTSDSRIFIDGRELPTTYTSPQQLSTTVPGSFIAAPGARQVMVRTPDNRLFSNPMTLSVAQAPNPDFTYVGIIGTTTRVGDTALVQEKRNRNIVSVQRGDLVGGRFRVVSISEKELVLMDATLRIQHKLAMTEGDKSLGSPLSRPTPRVDSEDDEP